MNHEHKPVEYHDQPLIPCMGRAEDIKRADRNGWSRNWAFGQPHYFLRGSAYPLCGAGATSGKLTLTEEPDGERPEGDRKSACTYCAKLLSLGKKGHSR